MWIYAISIIAQPEVEFGEQSQAKGEAQTIQEPKRMKQKKAKKIEIEEEQNAAVDQEDDDGDTGDIAEIFTAGIDDEEEADIQARRSIALDLVKKGKEFFKNNTLDVACNMFTRSPQFRKGEVYLFVFDTNGICYAHGDESDLLWKDFKTIEDEYGSVFVLDFIKTARKGGGWVSYRWHNASKISYVEMVEKNGVQYVIGGGYYPHSKKYSAVNLVKGAASFFKKEKAKGTKEDAVFSTFSYPLGRFIVGDLYIFMLDEEGNLLVQGDRPGLVGTNVLEAKDAKGMFVNKEIIAKANKRPRGIWVEYVSKGTLKRTYAERVTGKTGKHYYIACGYYPLANKEKAVDLVKEAYRHMKKGLEQALDDFNDRNDTIFHFGDLYLIVYNMDGKCVAHGKNSELIGRNMYGMVDQDGDYYVQDIIKMAQTEDKGWMNIKRDNAYEWLYLEKIDVGLDKFVIVSGIYPISKQETMELLAKNAAEYLKNNDLTIALGDFTKKGGKFTVGDLGIFVFEKSGICAAYGSRYDYIWQNLMDAKDEVGRSYVKMFINSAQRGPARVTYKMNGVNAQAYLEPVRKGNLQFTVGSSIYTYLDQTQKKVTKK